MEAHAGDLGSGRPHTQWDRDEQEPGNNKYSFHSGRSHVTFRSR
jgi:hypothetical protein